MFVAQAGMEATVQRGSQTLHGPVESRLEAQGYRYSWLLWFACALATCLPPLGVSQLLSLVLGASFAVAWFLANVSMHRLVTSMIIFTIDIFFREQAARNQFKVPPDGTPTLFICAPHANQFLDPYVVLRAIGRTDLCFLTAAKTMRRPILGWIARHLGAIPVERNDDVSSTGAGEIWLSPEDQISVSGRGTHFLSQFKVGDSIEVGCARGAISAIISDESMALKKPMRTPADAGADAEDCAERDAAVSGEWRTYMVCPRVDQSVMFESVFEAFGQGKSVGIFPEGGSHDRPGLLPLRVGGALMALGMLARHPACRLRIVPVGLNYFSGHRFRSRVFVDIGEPFAVPADILERYCAGSTAKFEATDALLEIFNKALGALTISAPDYGTLEFFWTLRRLTKSAVHGSI